MVISYHQQKRIDKVYADPLYLIDKTCDIDNNKITFKICGSTRLLYDINLHQNGSFTCSCPDMFKHNPTYVCKHICFVMIKVLKHASFVNFVLNHHKLDESTINHAKEICIAQCEAFNPYLAEQYHILKVTDFDCHDPKLDEGDECPICYCCLSNNNVSKLKACPNCKNIVHKECIEKWLDMSRHQTCVYCRSDVWKKYNETTRPGVYMSLD